MVVATSILALFLMLALGTIVPAFQITRRAEENIAAQREVILAFDRLIAEMGMLDRATVSTSPNTLSFLSDEIYSGLNGAIPDADLVDLGLQTDVSWNKYVILRHRDNNLYRREFDYQHGQQIFQIDPDKLTTWADGPGIAEKIFAKNVELFETEEAGLTRVYLKIRSVFRNGKKPEACQLTLQIQMRGSR